MRLGRRPTPLHALPNLSSELGGAELWLKRDDETGLAFGGNKVRQLEFYLGEAVKQNADTVLITGAVQSNFVRLAAAAANTLGMSCHIQLEERVATADPIYRTSGNVLLDRLLGATLHSFPEGEDEAGADNAVQEIAANLRTQGASPYIIPLSPGHPPLGALGYVDCAAELLEQLGTLDDVLFDEIAVASGSGNTHAGLLFGLRILGNTTRVTGVCVRRDATVQRLRIADCCERISHLLGVANPVGEKDIVTSDDALAGGYGQLDDSTQEAISLTAQREAVFLDPVYTAKTMAFAINRARATSANQRILMLHTGGTPALFAYAQTLTGTL